MKSRDITIGSIAVMRRSTNVLVSKERYLDYHSKQLELGFQIASIVHAYGINVSLRSEWMGTPLKEQVSLYMAYYKPTSKLYSPPDADMVYIFFDSHDADEHKKCLYKALNKFFDKLEAAMTTKPFNN